MMIDNVYKISNKNMYVYCEIEEYCKNINNWMKPYKIINSKKNHAYIKIFKDKCIWSFNKDEKIIVGKIKHTDLYPLFYNIISNMILDANNVLLHSAVICYNNKGVLVVGDFNSGKTTICLKAKENGMEVISADQTHLKYKNGKMMICSGSSYMKIDDDHEIVLDNNPVEIEIKIIINLIGVCDGGKLKITSIENKEHVIKFLFKHCTWHSDIPLFTSTSSLDIDRVKIYNWLRKNNIDFYNVRGDSKIIIEKIKEILK